MLLDQVNFISRETLKEIGKKIILIKINMAIRSFVFRSSNVRQLALIFFISKLTLLGLSPLEVTNDYFIV